MTYPKPAMFIKLHMDGGCHVGEIEKWIADQKKASKQEVS